MPKIKTIKNIELWFKTLHNSKPYNPFLLNNGIHHCYEDCVDCKAYDLYKKWVMLKLQDKEDEVAEFWHNSHDTCKENNCVDAGGNVINNELPDYAYMEYYESKVVGNV